MALSTPVPHDAPLQPARDWSCPVHAWPWDDEDDPSDDVGCLGCRYGKWVDRLDENGEPVMVPVVTLGDVSALIESLNPSWLDDVFMPVSGVTINWLEDEFGDG